jgi:ribonuclease HI
VILYDSEYAAKSITGEYNGPKNKELIQTVRQIYQSTQATLARLYPEASAQRRTGVVFVKVKAHSGNYFNDIADELAKAGSTGQRCEIGRFSPIVF